MSERVPREPDAATLDRLAELAYETYFDREWAEAGAAERALWRNVVRVVLSAVGADDKENGS